MPKAPRRCPADGCTNLIRSERYCPEHTTSWAVPSEWEAPPGWRTTREEVLERDDWTCYLCGGKGADTVDHIQAVHLGGRHTKDNLAAVHDRNPPHCHRTKTNQEKVPS